MRFRHNRRIDLETETYDWFEIVGVVGAFGMNEDQAVRVAAVWTYARLAKAPKVHLLQLVDAGKTQEEVLAENPLANYHDQYNWSFITTERMTTTLYRALTLD